jgi:hypothetical protein
VLDSVAAKLMVLDGARSTQTKHFCWAEGRAGGPVSLSFDASVPYEGKTGYEGNTGGVSGYKLSSICTTSFEGL